MPRLRRNPLLAFALAWLLVAGMASRARAAAGPAGFEVETAVEGQPLSLGAEVGGGDGPFAYQWYKDGVPLAGATGQRLTLAAVQVSDAGLYAVVVANAAGSAASLPVLVSVTSARPSRLANVAIVAGVAEPVLVGFALAGGGPAEPTRLLARAAGPALGALGIKGALPDPVLELTGDAGFAVANDNWGGSEALARLAASVGAFAFPADSRDAALAADLPPGSYTARVADAAGQAGTVAVELYEVIPAGAVPPVAQLANVAARGPVAAAGLPLTLGFTITGRDPLRLLVRGVGPALAGFGVAAPLSDPRLHLFHRDTLVASNEDWGEVRSADLASAAAAVRAFALPPGSRDAALLLSLDPGSYSVQLTGPAAASGVALIELYVVP